MTSQHEAKNKLQYPGINVVLSLDFTEAEQIKFVEGIPEDFTEKFGISEQKVNLYQALLLAKHELAEIDKKSNTT